MIQVKVRTGESIERALKRFKRRVDATGIMRDVRKKQEYTKASVIKRQMKKNAEYKQKKYGN